jgi:hypothetical protein
MSLLAAVHAFGEIDSLERRRAETLYASAVLLARSGYGHAAKGFGKECIALLKKIGTDTQEECATHMASVCGVPLPEYLHEDVVRDRLGGFAVVLN